MEMNPYQYAANNPLRYIDPLGLQGEDPRDDLDKGFESIMMLATDLLGGEVAGDAYGHLKTAAEILAGANKKSAGEISLEILKTVFAATKAGARAAPVIGVCELGVKIGIVNYNAYQDLLNERGKWKVAAANSKRYWAARKEARDVIHEQYNLADAFSGYDTSVLSAMKPQARTMLRGMATKPLLKAMAQMAKGDFVDSFAKRTAQKKLRFLYEAVYGEFVDGELDPYVEPGPTSAREAVGEKPPVCN
jgi:hypothetical protein